MILTVEAVRNSLGGFPTPVPVLGVPVYPATMGETVSCLEALVADGGPHLVATADASGIVIAQEDPELMAVYRSCAWVTADSYGVVGALKRKGVAVPRVSGCDLAEELLALSARKGCRVVFLGAAPGVAEAAKEQMLLKHPGCNIVGVHHGHFPESEFEFVAREVAALEPDILLVAMGIPRQEKFMARTQSIHRAKIAMGVGGTFDVMSGQVKRAPIWVQKLKIEWLWRTLSNPKKFSKAKTLPRFWLLSRREK